MVNRANHNPAENGSASEPGATTDIIRHLYVHIPFCARICPYCAFYKDLLDRSQTDRFCSAILEDLKQCSERWKLLPRTIYFGGGTPTALTTNQLEYLLRGLKGQVDLSELAEWTVEANPGSVSRRKAEILKTFGVNRISLGVQSWDERLLTLLGREHSAPQAVESVRILRAAGFNNINIDLMFGLPGQTIDQWRFTLEKTIELGPEHISTYCLTYEEDTDFFARHARGEFHQDPDGDADFFEEAMSLLEAAGYEHYEISNYARPGFASSHNNSYWAGDDYVGIGPSAFSTVGLRRWQNVCDYREYSARIFGGRSPVASEENLTDAMKRTERIALLLRTSQGVSPNLVASNAGGISEFLKLGLLRQSNGNFVLTRAGKALANSVAEALI